VFALAVNGSTVYAGGYFTSIGGENRGGIAALDAGTGLATGWNPAVNPYGFVNALAVSGGFVYAGGNFITIGGESRNNIAALDATTGLATEWNPGTDGEVATLMVSGLTVYAGGPFLTIGGETHQGFAAMQDSPTPTLLIRFDAEATSAGIRLRWQFGDPGRIAGVELERAASDRGPWSPLALESRRTMDGMEAVDATASEGETRYYRLTAHLSDGARVTFGPIITTSLRAVKISGLTGISPNPVSSNARIDFVLAGNEKVRISVVDVAGREAVVLADEPMAAGIHSILWDGRRGSTRLPAGTYFVHWTSSTRDMNRKLILLQ
jgi:hypothetical protein